MTDKGQVDELSNDQRQTIATMMVMCGVATDPGHNFVVTGTFYNTVLGGLVKKYGYSLRGLNPDMYCVLNNKFTVYQGRDNGKDYEYCTFDGTNEPVPSDNIPYSIQYCGRMLETSMRSCWGTVISALQRVQSDLINICVAEDLLDYTVVYSGLVDEIKKIRELRESGEEPEQDRTEKRFKVT